MCNKSKLVRFFTRHWYLKQHHLAYYFAQLVLFPIAGLFFIISTCRQWAYQYGLLASTKLNASVIVVGNISVGGTGKTPLVIYLVEELKKAGFKPGVISRGYGAKLKTPVEVFASSNPMDVGDEPVLIARRANCPVYVNKNRVLAGQFLLRAHPDCDVIICDDGLQHYALKRDIEVVVVDSARGFGNGFLLPAGPLREGVAKLNQVDAIVCNGNKIIPNSFEMTLKSSAFINLKTGKTATVSAFFQSKVHAIAGIGNPARFFTQLKNMGLVFEEHTYADHFNYQRSDLEKFNHVTLIMTEKDAVKCAKFSQENHWVMPVNVEMDTRFLAIVIAKLKIFK